mmetsp:Transcript_37753/g.99826  ORF Transcript_37753/g.99826 Transcript_37753/m.99826 type:complete len:99 (-) Transcript_37753:919-1215(-)
MCRRWLQIKLRAAEWEEHATNGGDAPNSPSGMQHFVCLLADIHRSQLHHITTNYKDIVVGVSGGGTAAPANSLIGEQVLMTVPVLQSDGTNVNAAVLL